LTHSEASEDSLGQVAQQIVVQIEANKVWSVCEAPEDRLGQVAQPIAVQIEVTAGTHVVENAISQCLDTLDDDHPFIVLTETKFRMLRYSAPAWSGQEPVRSRTPLVSVEKLQGPKVHDRLPSELHSAPSAVRNKERRDTIKSAGSADRPLL
jgi:hypothetical protein